MTLRDWLAKRPAPASVTLAGQPLVVPTGRKRWGLLAETIHAAAKAGDKLVAHDVTGAVIRATTYAPDDDDVEQSDEEAAAATSQNASDLQVFARLLAEATDRVQQRDEALFSRVFEAQNSLMQTFASRLSSLETAWHKQVVESAKVQAAMIQMAAEANAAQGEEAGLLGQIVQSFAAGQAQGALAAPVNGKPNGKPQS